MARIVVVARPQHEQQQARGAKRVQEDHQQPLPYVSTVHECANQGRESCEDRVNHSKHRHRNPEGGHGDIIGPRDVQGKQRRRGIRW